MPVLRPWRFARGGGLVAVTRRRPPAPCAEPALPRPAAMNGALAVKFLKRAFGRQGCCLPLHRQWRPTPSFLDALHVDPRRKLGIGQGQTDPFDEVWAKPASDA